MNVIVLPKKIKNFQAIAVYEQYPNSDAGTTVMVEYLMVLAAVRSENNETLIRVLD